MVACICEPAPAPYDMLTQVNPKCIAHLGDIRLVSKGWSRNGGLWTHPERGGLWTKEQALEVLND